VDLNELLRRHQIALMQGDRSESSEERHAHGQFASDYAEKIQTARAGLGAPINHPSIESAVEKAQQASAPSITARVVLMPSEALTYTVVMDRDGVEGSRSSFGTMREAEAHVRQITPTAAPRSTLYDRDSNEA
jgi:hypothetical protein